MGTSDRAFVITVVERAAVRISSRAFVVTAVETFANAV